MEPASPSTSSPPASGRSNLGLRIVSAAVLAPLALGIAYVGGLPFTLFWCAAALVVLWEWTRLVCGRGRRAAFATGAVSLAAAGGLLTFVGPARLGTSIAIVVL